MTKQHLIPGAPQMALQQYLFTLLCLPLPSGNIQTTFPYIPWRYLPISSSVFLSFLLLSLSPAELSSPCQRILRCGHTVWVSVSHHHALQLHSGFCCEPPHASHSLCRKCSEDSYSISSQGPACTCIKEGRYNERPHQLNLRSKRDVLVPPYDLQSRKSCCCMGCPGKNLSLWSFFSDDCPQGTWSSSLLLVSDLLSWSLCGSHLGCLSSLCLVWTDLHFVPCGGSIKTVYQDASFSFLFCIYDNVICKAEVVKRCPPVVTLPSWLSNASHMVLSRKMLKRVVESRHPCRTLCRTSFLVLRAGYGRWLYQFLIIAYQFTFLLKLYKHKNNLKH